MRNCTVMWVPKGSLGDNDFIQFVKQQLNNYTTYAWFNLSQLRLVKEIANEHLGPLLLTLINFSSSMVK